MTEEIFFRICAFMFGSFLGSFANVCIYRVPREQSIVFPPSRCPFCSNRIAFYDNIPILSYVLLRARCRHCGVYIPFRYFFVELLVATSSLALFMKYDLSILYFIYLAFVFSLVVLSFIDFSHRIIPNSITITGIFLGILFAYVLSRSNVPWPVNLKTSLIGVVFGGGSLALVGYFYSLLTGREGIGFGDVKLLAMFGAFFGWEGAFFSIFLGSMLGLIFSIPRIITSRRPLKYSIPFGPFLSMGLVIYVWVAKDFLDRLFPH